MRAATLARRGLVHHRRAHAAAFAGTALATAILSGALAVGDSVRASLDRLMRERLGGVQAAVELGERTTRDSLAGRIAGETGLVAAAALRLRGTAAAPAGGRRAAAVNVYGVEASFWRLMDRRDAGEGALLNRSLAERLGLSPGDPVVLRVERPVPLPRDSLFAPADRLSAVLRLPFTGAVPNREGGNFSLRADTLEALNAFVPLAALQSAVDRPDAANLLLVGGGAEAAGKADEALRRRFEPEDAGLTVRGLAGGGVEVATPRVFLDRRAADAALRAGPDPAGVLAYLATGLEAGNRGLPYPIVCAAGAGGPPGSPARGLPDDGLALHPWASADLGVGPGDDVVLRYLALERGELVARQAAFTVRRVLPADHPWLDPGLMPPFPGLTGRTECRDWSPGFDLDLSLIRPKDEAYWDRHGGTPKAFVTLAAGRRMWANRFGDLTAVRFGPAAGGVEAVRAALGKSLDPATQGLAFRPVGRDAARAVAEGLDYGALFVGFSLFLVAAALALTYLVHAFALERRQGEAGALLALGFPPGRVARIWLVEGACVAAAGAVTGMAAGSLYTRGALAGLNGIWRDAIGAVPLVYHASPGSLLAGGLGGFAAATAVMGLTASRLVRRRVAELLAASGAPVARRDAGRGGLLLAAAGAALAAGLLAVPVARGESVGAGAFFGAGAGLLLAWIGLLRDRLVHRPLPGAGGMVLASVARGNAARRPGRSLAVVGLLACGTFLVVSVGANRHDPLSGADRRTSGTGGFDLVASTAVAVPDHPGTAAGRRALDLSGLGSAVEVVAFRVREGDDASCLSLSRARIPTLLGVEPAELEGRFSFVRAERKTGDPWVLLEPGEPRETVPAIGDEATVVWGLGLGVGDEIVLRDEAGEPFPIRIAAILGNAVLQGSLVVHERALLRAHPSLSGYRRFLVDAPDAERTEAVRRLARRFEDLGWTAVPAVERLAALSRVEHAYLSIFLVLGGLGVLLGTLGLGIVLLRNLGERAGEFALLLAVGFTPGLVRRLLVREHAGLLLAGVAGGLVAGALAVAPAVHRSAADLPLAAGIAVVAGIVGCGTAVTWAAGTIASRTLALDALRRE